MSQRRRPSRKRKRTANSQDFTLIQGGGGGGENGFVSTPFGPLRAGSIIEQTTKSRLHLVSPKDWEKEIPDLPFKSSKDCDTSNTDTERLVGRGTIGSSDTTTRRRDVEILD